MPKIEDIGIGGYIRNPRGNKLPGSERSSSEILRISEDLGNAYLCFPVTATKAGESGPEPVTDTARYQVINKNTWVDQVTI